MTQFQDLFASLHRTTEKLARAHAAMLEVHTAFGEVLDELATTIEAASAAHGEQEDLRESVARLEKLVMTLLERRNGSA